MTAPRDDIAFTSRVDAEHLRFHERPGADVRFHGTPGRTATSRSERRNLPDRVTGPSEHRDVRVDYRLATRLDTEPEE
jgi:hypothetical protein